MTLQEWTDLFNAGNIPNYNTYLDWYYRIDRYLRGVMPSDEEATLADIALSDYGAGRMDVVAYEYLSVGFNLAAPPPPPPELIPRAEIASFQVPTAAQAGESVAIRVTVRNVGTMGASMRVSASYDSLSADGSPGSQVIMPGEQATFTISFTMPTYSIRGSILASSYDGVKWGVDDFQNFAIAVEVAPPPLALPRAAITDWTIPDSAQAGEPVTITVSLGNVGEGPGRIRPLGVVGGALVPFTPSEAEVEVGQVAQFTASFTMPQQDVELTIFANSWDGTKWLQDQVRQFPIAVAVAPPPPPEPAFANLRVSRYDKL